MSQRRKGQNGNSLVEFTLVGIPLIFVLIATFEMARGMWHYQTLAFAVKSGARYTIVHGQNCGIAPNACRVSISQIADKIRYEGPGLPADLVTLTFTTATGAATTCQLAACIADYGSPAWPPPSSNAPGQDVRISARLEFRSAMLMFWPGAGAATRTAPVVNLSADSRETIQY